MQRKDGKLSRGEWQGKEHKQMKTLWACMCTEEWMDEPRKEESECPNCGLIAKRSGGIYCICGRSGSWLVDLGKTIICRSCGRIYAKKRSEAIIKLLDSCFLRDHLFKESVKDQICDGLPYHPCGQCKHFVRKLRVAR